MNDLMVDLETLGTKSDAVVLSIGACFFDRKKKTLGEKFYLVLTIQDQINAGRKVNAATLQWWLKQNNAAQSVFLQEGTQTVQALTQFTTWITTNGNPNIKVWGNGSTFDVSIMEHIFDMFLVTIPWKYSKVRDLRTFTEECANNSAVTRSDGHHNALTDAIDQANYVLQYTK